jgi:hypothetical protein
MNEISVKSDLWEVNEPRLLALAKDVSQKAVVSPNETLGNMLDGDRMKFMEFFARLNVVAQDNPVEDIPVENLFEIASKWTLQDLAQHAMQRNQKQKQAA